MDHPAKRVKFSDPVSSAAAFDTDGAEITRSMRSLAENDVKVFSPGVSGSVPTPEDVSVLRQQKAKKRQTFGSYVFTLSKRPRDEDDVDDFSDDDEGEYEFAEDDVNQSSFDGTSGEIDDEEDENEEDRKEYEFSMEALGGKRRKEKAARGSDDESEEDEDDSKKLKEKSKRIERVKGEEADAGHDKEEFGYTIEPFHLKSEREEGHFDEAGNYIWKKNDDDTQADAWLQDNAVLSAESVKKIEERKKKFEENSGDDEGFGDEEGHFMKAKQYYYLYRELLDDETVTGALKRLGPMTRSSRGVPSTLSPELFEAAKKSFERVTDAAATLLSMGVADIYGCTRGQCRFEYEDELESADVSKRSFVEKYGAFKTFAELSAPVAAVSAPVDMFGDHDEDMKKESGENEWVQRTEFPEGKSWEFTFQLGDNLSEYGPFSSAVMKSKLQSGQFSGMIPYSREYVDSDDE